MLGIRVYVRACSGSPPPVFFLKSSRRSFSAQSIWNFLLMFTALWESFGGDSPIIRQHLNSLTSMSHRPQLKDIYSKNALDPFLGRLSVRSSETCHDLQKQNRFSYRMIVWVYFHAKSQLICNVVAVVLLTDHSSGELPWLFRSPGLLKGQVHSKMRIWLLSTRPHSEVPLSPISISAASQ